MRKLILAATDPTYRNEVAAARKMADERISAGLPSNYDDLLCGVQSVALGDGIEAIDIIANGGTWHGRYNDNGAFTRHGTWFAFKNAPSQDAAHDMAEAWYAADPTRRTVYAVTQ
jgi:hypothetical protein